MPGPGSQGAPPPAWDRLRQAASRWETAKGAANTPMAEVICSLTNKIQTKCDNTCGSHDTRVLASEYLIETGRPGSCVHKLRAGNMQQMKLKQQYPSQSKQRGSALHIAAASSGEEMQPIPAFPTNHHSLARSALRAGSSMV